MPFVNTPIHIRSSSNDLIGREAEQCERHMDDGLSYRLDGMVITCDFAAEKQPMTLPVGQLRAQALLSGILHAIYELQLPC